MLQTNQQPFAALTLWSWEVSVAGLAWEAAWNRWVSLVFVGVFCTLGPASLRLQVSTHPHLLWDDISPKRSSPHSGKCSHSSLLSATFHLWLFCVCFTAATTGMSQSSPTTSWSSSWMRRRRISSGSSRWAEKWSSTSSGSFSTTRRRVWVSRCSSLQTPCRPFKDIRAKVPGEPVQGTSSACWTEASKLSCLRARVCQVISRPACARRCGLCALVKLWRLLKLLANWNEHSPQRLITRKVFPRGVSKLSVWGGWIPGVSTVTPAGPSLQHLHCSQSFKKYI